MSESAPDTVVPVTDGTVPTSAVPSPTVPSSLRGIPEAATTYTLASMDELGPRLKELRQAAGLSLRELARQADVSPSLISQIENGKSRPSVSSLYTFARLLSVPVDELFDAEEHVLAELPAAEAAGGAYDPANVWHPSEYATRI